MYLRYLPFYLGDNFQNLKQIRISRREKLRGSNIFLDKGDIVYQLSPEEDGWFKVKTVSGEEGEIQLSSSNQGNNVSR